MESLKNRSTIIVHGGAWDVPKEIHQVTRQGVRDAAIEGNRVLANGGNCVDAVIAAVSSLEDNPHFDAGRGSVLNMNKEVEMHSMVMQGDTLDSGSVICIQNIKNPCQAAKLVLKESHHCALDGAAGRALARQHNLPEADLSYFVTEAGLKEFNDLESYSSTCTELFNKDRGHDTVGAVAVDHFGNVACCTSTGGITRQVAGRISDSGIIGSGGYADNDSAAISTTGHGESIMKVNLARMVSLQHSLPSSASLQQVVDSSLLHMKKRVQGCGGVISVDKNHNVGIAHTTPYMSWAKIGSEAECFVEYGIHQNEVIKESIESP